MFARGFVRGRFVRRVVGAIAALLAFIGGVLTLLTAITHGVVAGMLGIIFGLGALLSAWLIYRGDRALFFPRARLTFAGFMAIGAGVILFILGFGLDAVMVIGGGVLSWLATVL